MMACRTRIRAWIFPLAVLAAASAARAEPPARIIADLGWMEGSWFGTKDGVASEEHWTSPAGGALVGLHKDVKDGRMTSFEFLRIVVDPEGRTCYLASPGGEPPTAFCVRETGKHRIVFENREHDFPQRIIYWLDGAGKLHARIEGPRRGQEISVEWTWSRASRR